MSIEPPGLIIRDHDHQFPQARVCGIANCLTWGRFSVFFLIALSSSCPRLLPVCGHVTLSKKTFLQREVLEQRYCLASATLIFHQKFKKVEKGPHIPFVTSTIHQWQSI
jgi:hypothetical protein